MKYFIILTVLLLTIFTACNKSERKKSIAILTPISHPSLEQCEKGFIETIEKDSPGIYEFVTYNAQGNKTLMRGEVEEIAQKGYSLVFTLGTTSSQMVAEVFAKKRLETPVVFTCVNDPVGFHIVPSEESPGGNITGVKELLDFKKELDFMLKFKPNINTVLLVINPMEPGMEKDQKQIRLILKDKKIELITVEVFQTNEFMAKVSPFMEKADAMVVLKDNTVVAGLDVLIKLCDQHQIPLMASDLDSPDRGAAFGFGVHEIDFGIEGAKKALQILNKKSSAGDIPVTPVSKFTLKINRDAAQTQGIDSSLLIEELQ